MEMRVEVLVDMVVDMAAEEYCYHDVKDIVQAEMRSKVEVFDDMVDDMVQKHCHRTVQDIVRAALRTNHVDKDSKLKE